MQDAIAANLTDIRSRLARAAERAGRRPADVRLVAVSKTFPMSHVLAALAAGQRVFGENRVQEALEKIALSSDTPIEWHLIGHLQSNKARKAASSFACIHSIDSVELLRRVDGAAEEDGHQPELLIQVDLAGEPTKHGTAVDTLRAIFDAAAVCRAVRVTGLMVLPPFMDDPEDARPYFRRLREIRDELAGHGVSPSMLGELSMGMSHDFEIAIEEGATLVRIGTAIFGGRG
ncbi:MAG: YggS family pyridoxal phosphate-dependent enzyme [Acidobacteria bacterium]|nr:YggS family pyridoxal phosphate-dependent enzyme [Acidobacteriota bacterium]